MPIIHGVFALFVKYILLFPPRFILELHVLIQMMLIVHMMDR